MSGQKFTASQLAALSENFAEAKAGTIPGNYLIDGSVDWSKLDSATIIAALNAVYATVAQGANADTAFGWGDHALAGYALATQLRQGYHDFVTGTGAETSITLTATPVGQPFVVYSDAAATTRVWRDTVDYTLVGNVITFVTVTPLTAGHTIDVQYVG
jgi:hypothetical protein